MYQFKAVLAKTKEIIAEGHTLDEIEKQILHFKRGPKHNEHTSAGDRIDVFHVFREGDEKLLKSIN